MEAMTLLVDQSCQALNPAWMSQTAINTQASAKLAVAGGLPSGFQETNTKIPATIRILPKPPKKYPISLPKSPEGGGVILFGPYWFLSRLTSSSERPRSVLTDRRWHRSGTARVCHSRPATSAIQGQYTCTQDESIKKGLNYQLLLSPLPFLFRPVSQVDAHQPQWTVCGRQWAEQFLAESYGLRQRCE